MNTVVVSAQLVSANAIQNSSKVEAEVLVQAKNGKDSTFQAVTLEAWGEAGKSLLNLEEGEIILIQGSLRIEKNPSLHYWTSVSSITPLNYKIDNDDCFGEDYFWPHIFTLSIAGNLGQDPELHFYESGASRCSFSLASYRAKEISDWFNLVAWRKAAETIADKSQKGSQLFVTAKGEFNLAPNGKTYLNCEVIDFTIGKNSK
jgi:hypothetical protein